MAKPTKSSLLNSQAGEVFSARIIYHSSCLLKEQLENPILEYLLHPEAPLDSSAHKCEMDRTNEGIRRQERRSAFLCRILEAARFGEGLPQKWSNKLKLVSKHLKSATNTLRLAEKKTQIKSAVSLLEKLGNETRKVLHDYEQFVDGKSTSPNSSAESIKSSAATTLGTDSTTFRFLLVSDLHAGAGHDQKWLWKSWEDNFFDDLQNACSKWGEIDVVLFTGDMVFSGKSGEFSETDEIIDRLLSNIERWTGKRPVLLAVPGNHDLSRPTGLGVLKDWHSAETIRQEFWSQRNSASRTVVKKAFANYAAWWKERSARLSSSKYKNGILPGDFSFRYTKNNHTVGIVGLNSAFLQLDGSDCKGKLSIDVKQFHQACGGDAAKWLKTCSTSLLLTHHPSEWLCDKGAFLDTIFRPEWFAAHLYGHMHTPDMDYHSTAGTMSRCNMQIPSLFGTSDKSERIHGYVVCELQIGTEQIVRFWPRVASNPPARRLVPAHHHMVLNEDDGWSNDYVAQLAHG